MQRTSRLAGRGGEKASLTSVYNPKLPRTQDLISKDLVDRTDILQEQIQTSQFGMTSCLCAKVGMQTATTVKATAVVDFSLVYFKKCRSIAVKKRKNNKYP